MAASTKPGKSNMKVAVGLVLLASLSIVALCIHRDNAGAASANTPRRDPSFLRQAYEGIASRHKSKEDSKYIAGSHSDRDEAGTSIRVLKKDDQVPGEAPNSSNEPIDASPPSPSISTGISRDKQRRQSCADLTGTGTLENCECRSNCGGTGCSSVSIGECDTGVCCCGAECKTTPSPSDNPSSQPSSGPSGTPSSQPSENPSSQPSENPSSQPSSQPSSGPSENPSSLPSESPSSQPSSHPSEDPSSQPSANPSSRPSSNPSENPSSQPSENPSSEPSSHPSEDPSSLPSESPSSEPSSDPSSNPSSQPSSQPSDKPSQCKDLSDWTMPSDSIWEGNPLVGKTCAELEAHVPTDQQSQYEYCKFLSQGIFKGPCASEAVSNQR